MIFITAGYLLKLPLLRKHMMKVMHLFCLFRVYMKWFTLKCDEFNIKWHTLQKSAFVKSDSKYRVPAQLQILSTAGKNTSNSYCNVKNNIVICEFKFEVFFPIGQLQIAKKHKILTLILGFKSWFNPLPGEPLVIQSQNFAC